MPMCVRTFACLPGLPPAMPPMSILLIFIWWYIYSMYAQLNSAPSTHMSHMHILYANM